MHGLGGLVKVWTLEQGVGNHGCNLPAHTHMEEGQAISSKEGGEMENLSSLKPVTIIYFKNSSIS